MATVIRRPRTKPGRELVHTTLSDIAVTPTTSEPNVSSDSAISREELIKLAKENFLAIRDVSAMTGIAERSVSIYTSNTRLNRPTGTRMPEPDLFFGAAPIWHVQTIKEWDSGRKKIERLDKS